MADVKFFPYGNAEEKQAGKHWEFECQHGTDECQFNLVETCGINKIENAVTRYEFVSWVEQSVYDSSDYDGTVTKCAEKAGVENLTQDILSCYKGDEGNALEHVMGQATEALNPPNEYVPWITVDGVHDKSKEDQIHMDLLGFVCANYSGPNKSKDCPKSEVVKTATNMPKCYKDILFLQN